MNRTLSLLLLSGLCLGIASCGRGPQQASTEPAPVEPVANAAIAEIMELQSEPSADIVWGSVKTISDKSGVHHFRPKTDAEWAEVEKATRTLIGVAALVTKPDRIVVRPGSQIEEGGTLTAPEIQAMIAANRPAFLQRAATLDAAAREALAAVKARDADRLELAGGPIDDACEQCHLQFYYPEKQIAQK